MSPEDAVKSLGALGGQADARMLAMQEAALRAVFQQQPDIPDEWKHIREKIAAHEARIQRLAQLLRYFPEYIGHVERLLATIIPPQPGEPQQPAAVSAAASGNGVDTGG